MYRLITHPVLRGNADFLIFGARSTPLIDRQARAVATRHVWHWIVASAAGRRSSYFCPLATLLWLSLQFPDR